jgi:hypothetical protein
MATIALTTANRIEIVGFPKTQKTLQAGLDLTAGWAVQESTTGKWQLATGATAALARNAYVVTRTVKSGLSVTAVREGRLDGFDVSAMAFNDPIYLSDTGTLSTTAGTVSTVIGFVEAATANPITAAADKVVRLEPAAL